MENVNLEEYCDRFAGKGKAHTSPGHHTELWSK